MQATALYITTPANKIIHTYMFLKEWGGGGRRQGKLLIKTIEILLMADGQHHNMIQ